MKAFKELLQKKAKAGKVLSEDDIASKKEVLSDLKSQMEEQMAEGLKGMKGLKKVTVASDSPEGLKEGLEKAEEVVEKLPGEESEETESEEMEDESEDEEMSEEMSEDEIDAKLAELMAKKEKLKALKE